MCDGTPWRPPTCSTHCARGTEGAASWVPTQAAAGASPAFLTLTQTILPFLASPAGSRLASGRPCRRRRQPGAGRYPNYRPGWTVFHLPSTPWAADGRSIRSGRSGCTRFGLQRSQRGCPLVESSSRGAASPASGERRAGVGSIQPENRGCSGQIGLIDLPSADPPGALFVCMLPPWQANHRRTPGRHLHPRIHHGATSGGDAAAFSST